MVKKIKEMLGNRSVQYTILCMAASGINMLTMILFGRVFSVAEYGIVTTLQAMVTNIAILMTPLQIMLCRTIAGKAEDSREKQEKTVSLVLILNIGEAVILAAAVLPLMRYLHLVHVMDYVLFVLLVIANNIFLVMNGIAQGKQAFLLLGWATIALYGVKMILGVGLGMAGIGPTAMLAGFIAGEIAALGILVFRLRKQLRGRAAGFRIRTDGATAGEYLRIMIVYFVVSLYMNNGDLLLGTSFNSEEAIGLYSVAITLSKLSVFLIATPLATMLLPKVAEAKGKPEQQRKYLMQYEQIAVGLAVACGVALVIGARWLIPLLYGEKYRDAVQYMTACAVFSTVLSGFWVFYQYTMATELEKSFIRVAVVVGVCMIVGILASQPAIGIIPLIMTGAMVLTVVGTYVFRKR